MCSNRWTCLPSCEYGDAESWVSADPERAWAPRGPLRDALRFEACESGDAAPGISRNWRTGSADFDRRRSVSSMTTLRAGVRSSVCSPRAGSGWRHLRPQRSSSRPIAGCDRTVSSWTCISAASADSSCRSACSPRASAPPSSSSRPRRRADARARPPGWRRRLPTEAVRRRGAHRRDQPGDRPRLSGRPRSEARGPATLSRLLSPLGCELRSRVREVA